jgi:hypothetical protein
MFCTICEFNNLRVAKIDTSSNLWAITPLANAQRHSVHQFLAAKSVSSKMRSISFAKLVKISLSSALSAEPMIMPAPRIGLLSLFSVMTCTIDSSVEDYRDASLAIVPTKFRIEHTPKLILWLGLTPSTSIARAISFIGPERRLLRDSDMSGIGSEAEEPQARAQNVADDPNVTCMVPGRNAFGTSVCS